MDYLGPAFLALVIASLVTWLELVTSKYPRTISFLWGSWQLYVYAGAYGLIAFAVVLLLQPLIESGQVQFESAIAKNPWVQGAAVGITIKSLMHIRLLTIKDVPIGVETLVHLFEPWLLEGIGLDEFAEVDHYIRGKAGQPPYAGDLPKVKTIILDKLPTLPLSNTEKIAFREAINQCTTVEEAMILFLRRFGRRIFEAVFP
jgi:hypothetical protein